MTTIVWRNFNKQTYSMEELYKHLVPAVIDDKLLTASIVQDKTTDAKETDYNEVTHLRLEFKGERKKIQ